MRWDPEAASLVLHEPWRRVTQIPVDPTTKTFFKPEFFAQLSHGHAPFDAYLARFGQPFPMWDELAVAVWLDPSIVTRSQDLLVDIDTSFTAGYGNTLSWAVDAGPGLGERPVRVIQEVDVPKFERMTLDLLSRTPPEH
jgi:inosine-uridine nucleoside N-ribohydrolase